MVCTVFKIREAPSIIFDLGGEVHKDKIYISPCGKTAAWVQGEKHVDEFPIVKTMQNEEIAQKGSYVNDTEKEEASPYTIGVIVVLSVVSLWFILRKDKNDSKKE